MIRYRKLGYVELNVTDVARSREFFEKLVGLEFVDEVAGVRSSSARRHSSSFRSLTLLAKAARARTRLGNPSVRQKAARCRPFQRLSDESAGPARRVLTTLIQAWERLRGP